MNASTRQMDNLPPIWNIRDSRSTRFLLDERVVESIASSLRQTPICILEPMSAELIHAEFFNNPNVGRIKIIQQMSFLVHLVNNYPNVST